MNDIINNFTIELASQINAMTVSDAVVFFFYYWLGCFVINSAFGVVKIKQNAKIKAHQDYEAALALNGISIDMFHAAQHAMKLTFPKGKLYDIHLTSLWNANRLKRSTYE
ncbi:hypothetical protein ERJ77_01665 [Vibrio anguillarum]|uniref:Uncharacterized protein n=1 Tax=Vibrio anguillarum TaxID=55601 RepID=A0AAW4B8E5_VIBAN|nr:hypothetical protein [Vibrio anguillarum]